MKYIKKLISENLVGDIYDPENVKKWFLPKWLVSEHISRYKINKTIKELVKNDYVKYVSLGGGCDEDYNPNPPFNGYEVTEKGLLWLESEGE